jgi:hypothetical protein
MDARQVERFFAVYPDGRLVAVVRDPQSWYVSARRHGQEYRDLAAAMALWKASTQATLDSQARYGSAVYVLAFKDLLSDTEGTMWRLATYLGLDFPATLLKPTFNGRPIKADSSFAVKEYGVLQAPLHRAEAELTARRRRPKGRGGPRNTRAYSHPRVFKHPHRNVQRPTRSTSNVQRPTSNVQRPTSNVQRPTSTDGSAPVSRTGLTLHQGACATAERLG